MNMVKNSSEDARLLAEQSHERLRDVGVDEVGTRVVASTIQDKIHARFIGDNSLHSPSRFSSDPTSALPAMHFVGIHLVTLEMVLQTAIKS